MNLSEFDYELPPERIAKFPVTPRDRSRLLVAQKKKGSINGSLDHHHFYDLPDFLNEKDLLIFNDTKVIPARLKAWDHKQKEFEIFLLRSTGNTEWECLARPGKKISEGTKLTFGVSMEGTLSRSSDPGIFRVNFRAKKEEILPWIFLHGAAPLPPYLKRKAEDSDRERYQTIFAKEPGSVAAPTAGLHFTEALLERLLAKGVRLGYVTLHVSYGTFAPLREDCFTQNRLHEETFEVPRETLQLIEKSKTEGGKIIPVGTTSLRTLESIPPETLPKTLKEGTDTLRSVTQLFIKPGYPFVRTDGLVTNFHLPQSSLFVLVCALMGKEFAHQAYQTAIEKEYRFYSYGDAMLVL